MLAILVNTLIVWLQFKIPHYFYTFFVPDVATGSTNERATNVSFLLSFKDGVMAWEEMES